MTPELKAQLDRLEELIAKATKPYPKDNDDLRAKATAERELYEVLPTLLASVKVMVEWQPIETAPKDGTHIIATDGEAVQESFFDAEDGWVSVSRQSILWNSPTHWHPRPPPPTKDTPGQLTRNC